MRNNRLKLIIIFILFIASSVLIGILYNNAPLKELENIDKSFFIKDDLYVDQIQNDSLIAATDKITATVNQDFVSLNYTKGNGFRINNTNSYSGSVDIRNWGGAVSGANGYISLPNGTYYIFSTNVSNMSTTGIRVDIKNSCNNSHENLTNQTGTNFTYERCFTRSSNNNVSIVGKTPTICAAGYKFVQNSVTNDCNQKTLTNGVSKRYCKVVYNISCVKDGGGTTNPDKPTNPDPVPAAKLSSLSVNNGSLSPGFNPSTYKYTVNVDSNVSSIQVNASAASGSSFVSGSGPRTVDLNYGSNSIKIKVKNSAGKQTTYTITVNRPDNRSTVNTLSNLKFSKGTLNPPFSSDVMNYTLDVDNNDATITVDATLTDSSSMFVAGYGPGTVTLEPGVNKVYIKVTSQRGETNVYNITVNRATEPSECTTDTENLALLKGLELSADISDVELDQLEDFDPKIFTYSNIKIPYKVVNFEVKTYFVDETDYAEVEGNEDLVVGEPREVKITVHSKKCSNYTNIYTLNVERQPEVTLGDNADLTALSIKDHEEFKFEPNTLNYNLVLHKGEESLALSYTTKHEKTICEEMGNENLSYGSVVTLNCISEDEEDVVEYKITIDGIEKGTNVFIIILVVIIIILLLIYVVLRLLGYRIYFNFSVFGAFFRGIGEKFNNMFDK